MKKQPILISFLFLLLFGCATVYVDPSFGSIQSSHKIMAILPFDVVIESKKLPEGMTLEMLKEQEEDEGRAFQSVVHSTLLQQYAKGKYKIEFQDISKTNSLLRKSNVEYENLRDYSKDELAALLGVDVISSGIIRRAAPMSAGAAVAMSLVTGFAGTTNKVSIDYTIHEANNGKMIWKFTHEVSGGLLTNSESLAKGLMKQVANKFPYKK